MTDKPDDLHAREYAMQILESLGWPNDKGQSPNLLLIAECLIGISKAKRLTHSQAHGYMERAIRLAREQGVTVDRFFFRDGVYMQMRPKTPLPQYRAMSRDDLEAIRREQATPEFKAMQKQMDDLLKKLSGQAKMEGAK